MKARKKVLIDVIPVEDFNWDEVLEFTNHLVREATPEEAKETPGQIYRVYDRLHAVWVPFAERDYVARGPAGECYPIAQDVFFATYEIV